MFEYQISVFNKQKPPVHKWDGREIPVVPPKLTTIVIHFVPTNISLPCNAGTASCTTYVQCLTCNVFTQEAQEGTSTGFGRMGLSAILSHLSGGFRQPTFLCHCLYLIGLACCALLSAKMGRCQGLGKRGFCNKSNNEEKPASLLREVS